MREEQRREGSPALVVLDSAGVDLLELVRLGAQPSSALHRYLGNEATVLLCDEENTPLSELSASGVTHVRPLATGVGLAWSQELRRHVSSITEVAAPTIALIAYLPPSIAELSSLITRANEIDAKHILLCALVSRTPAPDGEVQPSGLLRAITSAAKELQASLPTCQITPLSVPWPKSDLTPEDLARAYGATEVVTGAERYAADAPLGYPAGSAEEIRRARSSEWQKGAVVFFTGLSGSGKSTVAAALAELLRDEGARGVALLDGDVMRRSISAGLGFDRASRNTNVQRLGAAAAELARAGGIAIAAPIAPFAEGRALARKAAVGLPFLLVHISTPLEVCEQRDRKGLYKKARAGEISDFTGISSPYEAPDDADLVIDASAVSAYEAATQVKELLKKFAG
ncbi:MAG: adenylyl-sulfate kinase [Chloroflexi bacterium]|nr:MAG: adenylyl-sulfate kinase [Chloroflexota bacterium]